MKRNLPALILCLFFAIPVFSQYNLLTTFTYQNSCFGDSTQFSITNTSGLDSIRWNFDDIASGANNTSTSFTPFHIFSSPGSYNVSLISYSGSIVYNFNQIIIIQPLPNVSLHADGDTTICTGSILTLDAGSGYVNYLWWNSTIAQTAQTTNAGTYWVEVTDSNGCVNRDSIDVFLDVPAVVDLGPDTNICAGDTIILNAGSGFLTYEWQDGSVDSVYEAGTSQLYWVEVTNACGPARDSLFIDSLLAAPYIYLGPDTSICLGDTITLDPGPGFQTYVWQDFSMNQTYSTGTQGTYWVAVSDQCGIALDTIDITIYPSSQANLGGDTTICSDEELVLDPGSGFASYLWQDGSTNQTFTVTNAGLYWLQAVDMNGCNVVDSVSVNIDRRPDLHLGGTRYLCIPYITLDAGLDADNYVWQDGSTSRKYTVYETGTYRVTVNNGNCYASDSVRILDCHSIWVPNAFTPNGDGTNDVFKPITEDLINYKIHVYNRFGELIFESDDPLVGWYGTDINTGDEAPLGFYMYIITYDGVGNVILEEEGIKTGNVYLYR